MIKNISSLKIQIGLLLANISLAIAIIVYTITQTINYNNNNNVNNNPCVVDESSNVFLNETVEYNAYNIKNFKIDTLNAFPHMDEYNNHIMHYNIKVTLEI